jgi:hypothetical protein
LPLLDWQPTISDRRWFSSAADCSRIEAIPSVTSTLFNLSQDAELLLEVVGVTLSEEGVKSHPGQPLVVDGEIRDLERDLEWIVEALCWDEELCRLPVRDISLEVGRVAEALDVCAVDVATLLLERPTLAKRAPNPAKRRGNVVLLLLLCWLLLPLVCAAGLSCCCIAADSASLRRSSSAGRESHESRRWARARDSSEGAAAGEGRVRSSKSSSSSLSSTL